VTARHGFRFGIRAKLLLASLSLLVVPWLGYQYIQALEGYLRQAQDDRLLNRVSLLASLMHDRTDLFRVQPGPATAIDAHIYVRPLQSPIQLDGYEDDWDPYVERRQALGDNHGNDLSVHYRTGVLNDYLYLLFEVSDDHVVYRRPNSLHLDKNDYLSIGVQDRNGAFHRYLLATIAPGWVNAYLMADAATQDAAQRVEYRIKGEWQDVVGGYNIEIRIPVDMIGGRIAFEVADVDDAATRVVETRVGNGDTQRLDGLGSIVMPSPAMEALLQRLQKPANRIWVIAPGYRVIGMAGSLGAHNAGSGDDYHSVTEAKTRDTGVIQAFYRLLLDQPSDDVDDRLAATSRLDVPAVRAALAGEAQVSRRQAMDRRTSIITAAHPVYVGDELIGAVAIEETSDSVLILQNRAIEALVNMSVLAFALTIGVLLVFATRLSLRVRRLRNDVDASIAPDGRIRGVIASPSATDELGDLGRSFHTLQQRLAQYNRYLETMAGKLAHELRTPIAIVRSSLDNLDNGACEEQMQTYLARAHEGIERLSGILGRMSEATHLEQTIRQEPLQSVVLYAVIASCVDAYRLAHPRHRFIFNCDDKARTMTIIGSAELLAQMLDKLIDNAVDFAVADTAIEITLQQQYDGLVLSVANEGPELPQVMRDSLFDSMVSLRDGRSEQVHLGLGLYIVRLIADYHQARLAVDNLSDRQGVVFRIKLPLP